MKISTLFRSFVLLTGLLLPLSNLLRAQTSLTLSSATVPPGGSTTLNLSLSSSPSSPLAAVQWTFSYPATSMGSLTVAAGPALTSAGDTLSCASAANSYTCVAWGLNSNAISNGVVATVSVTLSGSSNLPVTIGNSMGVSPTGDAINVTGTGGTVSVVAVANSISSIACSPGTLAPSASSTCTVILSGSAGGTIGLSSNSTNLTVPASLTIPAGSVSGTFLASATAFTADQTATVTATLNGSSQPSTLSLATVATISSLQCATGSLATNASTICTVTLSKSTTNTTVVALSSNASPLLTVPSSVSVAANTSSATFTASTGTLTADQTATLTASLNGSTAQVNMPLIASIAVSSLQCAAPSLAANASTTCTVTLTKAAPNGGASISISGAIANILTLPASVTVLANATTATFTASTGTIPSAQTATITASLNGSAVATSNQTATITPSLGGSSQSTTLALLGSLTLSSFKCAALSVPASGGTICTVTLSQTAPPAGATVFLYFDNPGLTIPSSVTVPANSSSATFIATARGAAYQGTSVALTATLFGASLGTKITIAGSSSASFQKTDTTTLGSWKGVYGTEGYYVANDSSSPVAYGTVTPSTYSQYTWAASSSDLRALQKPSVPNDRLAACWYGDSFAVDVNFSDANVHQVALYFLDWDSLGRTNRVDILDGSTGNVLDTQTVWNFTSGQYWIWNLSGHVTLRITAIGGANAVLSGLFFGGKPAVKASSATSAFLQTDTTTLGSWKGIYGSEGYYVINDSSSPAAYGTVTPSGNSQYTWAASSSDLRALQKASVPTDRLAACWYSASSFTVDVNFSDNNVHQVALYFLDWDSGRTNRVDILDAPTGNVLDTRTISKFTLGQYWIWNLSGHVTIRITNTGGANAVLSGLFFGGKPAVVKAPPSTSAFLRTDTTTLGSWKGVYGTEGYYVANDSSSPVAYGTVTPSTYSQYTWAASSSDLRALQKPSVPNDRLAACWYGDSFAVDVNFSDANVHQVALYFLDWDSSGRTNRVDILDGSTGNVLDTRTVSKFTSGQYWIWNLSGHVTIRVTAIGGSNAVLSGIFFGGK